MVEYDAFISYSHHDRPWVRETLVPALRGAGLRICIDYESFEPGEPTVLAIERAIQSSKRVLLVVTPNYLESRWGEFENVLAYTLDPAAFNRRIIPLMVSRCSPPTRIKYLTWVDLADPDERVFQMDRLLATLSSRPLPRWRRSDARPGRRSPGPERAAAGSRSYPDDSPTLDESELQRRRDNFARWKSAVGLPQSFPSLQLIDDADLLPENRLYLGLPHADAVEEILIRAPADLTFVQFASGHGCTTIARYVFRQLSQLAVRTRLMPVWLSLADVDVSEADLTTLTEQIRRQVLTSLLEQPWQLAFSPWDYRELTRTRGGFGEAEKRSAREAIGRGDWRLVEVALPLASSTLPEILAALADVGVRMCLVSDQSSAASRSEPGVYSQLMLEFVRFLKDLHERNGATREPGRLLGLSEVCFGPRAAFDLWNHYWERPATSIDFPWYRDSDLFAILAYQYWHHGRPAAAEQLMRTDTLTAVFTSSFVEGVASADASLEDMVREVESRILMQMRDWRKVGIQLIPETVR